MNLKDVRKELRFAQNVVAKASNISAPRLCTLENELGRITEKEKEKLINGYLSLGYDVDEKINKIFNMQKTNKPEVK